MDVYTGTAYGFKRTNWQGKTLYPDTNRGINRFLKDGAIVEKYPFTFSVTKSLKDKNKDVITLDYNVKGNPWWLKFIRDEMVQTGEGEYRGTVYLVLATYLVFTLGFFTLKR